MSQNILVEQKHKAASIKLDPPSFQYGQGVGQTPAIDFATIFSKPLTPSSVEILAPPEVTMYSLKDCPEEYSQKIATLVSPTTAILANHYNNLQNVHIMVIPSTPNQPIFINSTSSHNSIEQFLIIAKHGTNATIIENHSGTSTYKSHVMEVFIETGASLHINTNFAQDNNLFATRRAQVQGKLTWTDCAFTGKFLQLNTKSTLTKEHAQATTHTMYYGENENFDFNIETEHQASHSTGEMKARGVLNGKSKATYRGSIIIPKKSSHCVSHQKSNALILGDEAKSDAIPILEVENDEVICSHGAAMGQLNEEDVFYLQSRGLSQEEATNTIVQGFFYPILKDAHPIMREKIESTLQNKLRNPLDLTKEFPLLEQPIIYLDNSATTQKPKSVIDSISNYYNNYNANVHRGIYKISQIATMEYEKAHTTVANFINAKPTEIIFTKGTTESLNLLAYSLGKNLQPGDEIVLTEMEHHSNIVPWQQLKEKGIIIKYIPIKDGYSLDLHAAENLITQRTKIVSATHMSNVLGTINDVKHLAQLAHKVGAKMVVDAAQSVPHMPVDVKELDCDFLAFSGHKMCGPTGIGVLYGKEELLTEMDPFQFGGDMIHEVTFEKSTWNELPWKFEAGTPPIAQGIALGKAVEFLQSVGMENIQKHSHDLSEYAVQKLQTIPGITIIGPRTNRGPVLSFTDDEIHPHDMSEILDRDNIAVRAGHHCAMPLLKKLGLSGTTRASFYLYNTKSDVDALVAGIKKAQEIFQ